MYLLVPAYPYTWSYSIWKLEGKNLFWQSANTISLVFTFSQGKPQIYMWSEKPLLIRWEHLFGFNGLCLPAPLSFLWWSHFLLEWINYQWSFQVLLLSAEASHLVREQMYCFGMKWLLVLWKYNKNPQILYSSYCT